MASKRDNVAAVINEYYEETFRRRTDVNLEHFAGLVAFKRNYTSGNVSVALIRSVLEDMGVLTKPKRRAKNVYACIPIESLSKDDLVELYENDEANLIHRELTKDGFAETISRKEVAIAEALVEGEQFSSANEAVEYMHSLRDKQLVSRQPELYLKD
jgi:hypothetical protein